MYHYAANNPVRYIDPTGEFDLDDISNAVSNIFTLLTSWHYENRDSKNDIHEFENDADAYSFLGGLKDGETKNGWRRENRDACHQNGDEYHDEKYCNEDGRELVFDGKSINDNNPKIDRKPLTKGTYNYCDPGEKPSDENGKNNLLGWTEYVGKGIGHGICDLIPWYILGNSREESASPKAIYGRIKDSLK